MIRSRKIISIFITLNVIWLLALLVSFNRTLGPLPALLPMLNPATGLWSHQTVEWKGGALNGLLDTVSVTVDQNGVFHIFAKNDHDLYFAQGYLTASKRLFQMDLSTRVAAGKLAELVGPKGLDFDRYFIQFGMRDYANHAHKKMMANPATAASIEAYIEGANLWISQLSAETLPPEYKILNVWPKPFDSSRVANLLLLMSYNLAGRSYDLEQTQFKMKHGLKKATELFPDHIPLELESFVVESGYPKGQPTPSGWLDYFPQIQKFPKTFMPHPSNGSNNFAVSAKKSATGVSIVANDTHLSYSLPNVWIENHLVSPSQNVYGVSFPMGPGVVLGFNAQVAWAVTNGTTDVLDWYEVQFKDEKSLEYKWGEEWLTARSQSETILASDDSRAQVEVIETKAGFILQREGRWALAAKWVGYEISDELNAILKLNQAKSFSECRQAISLWRVPVQNWICADAQNLGIFHQGYIPVRAQGEGHFIEQGRPQAWSNSIPAADLPNEVNPARGFVRSANERIVPTDYKYYMGWDYEDAIRAATISASLNKLSLVTAKDLMALQNSVVDNTAAQGLPLLLKFLDVSKFSESQNQTVLALEKWNYVTLAKGFETTIYKSWWRELRKIVFDPHSPDPENAVHIPRWRQQMFLQNLAKNPNHEDAYWLKLSESPTDRSLSEVVTQAFLNSWADLEKKFGSDYLKWSFADFQKTEFPHIAKIPGFGKTVEVDGSSYSVRANAGVHGPVYKMVVELAQVPKAWSMVPGGAEGDPFAPGYGRDLHEWSEGKMKPVEFYQDLLEAKGRGLKEAIFTPAKSEVTK